MTSEAPQDVAALRELAEAATKGPWVKASGDAVFPLHSSMPVAWTRDMSPDAAYIAAASPDVVLGLLDQNDRLRSALERITDICREYRIFNVANRSAEQVRREVEGTALAVLRGSGAEEAARNE